MKQDNYRRGLDGWITALLLVCAGLWFLLGAWTLSGRTELPTAAPAFAAGAFFLFMVAFRLWRSRPDT